MIAFLITFVEILFQLLNIFLLLYILLSWFQLHGRYPFARLIDSVIEPLLLPIRRMMPRTGMLDFSPIVLYFLMDLLRALLIRLLLFLG